MKKQVYWLIALLSLLFVTFLSYSLLNALELDWSLLFQDLERVEKVTFTLLVFSFSLTCFLLFLWQFLEEWQRKRIGKNLKRLMASQTVETLGDPDLDASFVALSGKLSVLTEGIQKAENQELIQEEAIVEKERKRIARDLHDTVSQELFAAHMILSGVSQQALRLDREKMQGQLESVGKILETAQRDLRILLLHLRPIELESKSLVEGIQVLLKELEDKSELEVGFKHDVIQVPKKIEEHIFRIVQELISNTLRHAQASRLDLYLYQKTGELQLKVVDDGLGFQENQLDEWSYGLRNIRDRVEDMAGILQVMTAPKQGFAVDIRIPILDRS